MPEHLRLQDPLRPGGRRQGAGAPPLVPRNPRKHGAALKREFETSALRPRNPVVDGVDPNLVFKIAGRSRITDQTWAGRGLTLLGESEDWTYFVLSPLELPDQLRRELDAY